MQQLQQMQLQLQQLQQYSLPPALGSGPVATGLYGAVQGCMGLGHASSPMPPGSDAAYASPMTGAASPMPGASIAKDNTWEALGAQLRLPKYAKQDSVSRVSSGDTCCKPVVASERHFHCLLCKKMLLLGKSGSGALKHMASIEHYLSWYKETHPEALRAFMTQEDVDTHIRKLYDGFSVGLIYKNESREERLAREQSHDPPKSRKRKKVGTRLQHGPAAPPPPTPTATTSPITTAAPALPCTVAGARAHAVRAACLVGRAGRRGLARAAAQLLAADDAGSAHHTACGRSGERRQDQPVGSADEWGGPCRGNAEVHVNTQCGGYNVNLPMLCAQDSCGAS